MKLFNFLKLIIAILICESAGIIGSVFTAPSIPTWYAGLAKPKLSPPNWVFGPVWTMLFVLMGIAAFLVWTSPVRNKMPKASADMPANRISNGVKVALAIFGIQLGLNTLWSIIFFGMKNPGGAFIEIIFLWLAIVVTIIAFYKISKPAAWLLIPYILWVSFAVYLNYSIWQLSI